MAKSGAAPLLFFAMACAEAPVDRCPAQVDVVDPARFTVVPEDEDPFERGAGTSTAAPRRCTEADTAFEPLGDGGTFSIVTWDCSRLTVATRTLETIAAAEPLELRIFHFALIPYGSAEASIAVSVGAAVVFERRVVLPSDSKLLTDVSSLPDGAPLGTEIAWHVSNHGTNSWNWLNLSVTRSVPCP